MSPENKALVERFAPSRSEQSIMRLYPELLDRLMNAVRAEERARAVEVVSEIRQWADEALNGGDIVIVRRLEDISDAAAAYITDSQDTGQ